MADVTYRFVVELHDATGEMGRRFEPYAGFGSDRPVPTIEQVAAWVELNLADKLGEASMHPTVRVDPLAGQPAANAEPVGTREAMVRVLAQLLAGLEAPRGLGLLGAAAAPRDALANALVGFGYHQADEYEAALRSVLGMTSPSTEAIDDLGRIAAMGRKTNLKAFTATQEEPDHG